MTAKFPAIALSLTLAISSVLSACSQPEAYKPTPEKSLTDDLAIKPEAAPEPTPPKLPQTKNWITIGESPKGARAEIQTPVKLASGDVYRTNFKYLSYQENGLREVYISGTREDNCKSKDMFPRTLFSNLSKGKSLDIEDQYLPDYAQKSMLNTMLYSYICDKKSQPLMAGSSLKKTIKHLESLGYAVVSQPRVASSHSKPELGSEYIFTCGNGESGCYLSFEKLGLPFKVELRVDYGKENLIESRKIYSDIQECKAFMQEAKFNNQPVDSPDNCQVIQDYQSNKAKSFEPNNIRFLSRVVAGNLCDQYNIRARSCILVGEYQFKDGFLFIVERGIPGFDIFWAPNNPISQDQAIQKAQTVLALAPKSEIKLNRVRRKDGHLFYEGRPFLNGDSLENLTLYQQKGLVTAIKYSASSP